MKKILSLLFLLAAVSSFAATSTIVVTNTQFVQVPLAKAGPALVKQITITVPNTNAAFAGQFYDSTTNALTYTLAAYNSILTYPTNQITTWTNYYGVTNSLTNLALVDVTITNAASTNNFPLMFSLSAPANTTIVYDGLSALFQRGIWVTNTSGTNVTLTVNYMQ